MFEEFASESKKFLDKRASELKVYAKSLKGSLSNKDLIISAIVSFLKSKIKDRGNSGYTDSADDGLDIMLYSMAEDMYLDPSFKASEESAGDVSLALLGGVLSENPSAVFSFIKNSADAVDSALSERSELILSIKSLNSDLDDILGGITPDWYGDELMSLLRSASNSLNNASETMNKILSSANNGIVDPESIREAGSEIGEAIIYLNNKKTLKSIGDISYIVDSLETMTADLFDLDDRCNRLLDGLLLAKSSFISSSSESNRILSHYKRTTSLVDNHVSSVKEKIDYVIRLGMNQGASSEIGKWVDELSSCVELLDSSIVDFNIVISDPEDELTQSLDLMIANIGSVSSPVSESIYEGTREIMSLARRMIYRESDYSVVQGHIADVSIAIDSNVAGSSSISFYTSSYEPSPIEEVTSFISLINSLGEDRIMDLLMESRWGDIISMGIDAVSIIGNLRHLTSEMLAEIGGDIADRYLREQVLDFYFKIQAMHNSEAIMSLSHDVLKSQAMDDIMNVKIPEINSLTEELNILTKKLNDRG